MTDRDRPLPGQDPEAWRAGSPSGPDLRELQATDALLDRLALRLPSRDDLRDPVALALVVMTTEVDAGLPVSTKNGRPGYGPLNGTANGRRYGTAVGHTNGRAGGGGNAHANGNGRPVNGSNGTRVDDLNVEAGGYGAAGPGLDGYEIIGDGGQLRRSASQRPTSLADWKDRLVELATRRPLVVLGVAAATVAIISGGVAVGRAFAPLPGMPNLPGPGSTSQNQQLASQINSALNRADRAAEKGQAGNARQALDDAQRAVARLPLSPAKETYQKQIEKLRLKVDKTALPPITPGSPSQGVASSPTSSPSASPSPSVTASPSGSVSDSPTESTSPTTSPTTVTTSPTGVPTFAGSDDPTPTDGGVIPNGPTTSGTTAP